MSSKEKISYLKGVLEAYGINKQPDKKENKVLLSVLEALEELAEETGELREMHGELEEYVENIDEDLARLEDYYEDEDEGFGEIACPNCGEVIYLDEAMSKDTEELICPACRKKIELE